MDSEQKNELLVAGKYPFGKELNVAVRRAWKTAPLEIVNLTLAFLPSFTFVVAVDPQKCDCDDCTDVVVDPESLEESKRFDHERFGSVDDIWRVHPYIFVSAECRKKHFVYEDGDLKYKLPHMPEAVEAEGNNVFDEKRQAICLRRDTYYNPAQVVAKIDHQLSVSSRISGLLGFADEHDSGILMVKKKVKTDPRNLGFW